MFNNRLQSKFKIKQTIVCFFDVKPYKREWTKIERRKQTTMDSRKIKSKEISGLNEYL